MNSEYGRSGDGDEIGLRSLIARMWLQKWWIVASAVLMASVFGVVAYRATPVYRATTVLIPATGGGAQSLGNGLGALAGVASVVGLTAGMGTSNEDEAIAVLSSREFIDGYVQDKGLLPALFPDAWDARVKNWKNTARAPTLAKAHKAMVESILSISKDRTTGLVTVSVEWNDREAAALWANELVDRLNAEMRMRALEQAEAFLGYLKDELKATTQLGVQDAINRLIEAQINKRMLANVTQQYAFRIVDRATVPDESDRVRPRKKLLMGAGLILGLVLGALGVLLAPLLPRRA